MKYEPVVVIGGSAGGIQALRELIGGLKPNSSYSILIVVHLASGHESQLPKILNGLNSLPVSMASDGQVIEAGKIYLAPNDRHLIVENKKLKLLSGPKENGFRPAIDPLFVSAAVEFGSAATGILLSGALDDGSAGLRAIKATGGLAIVQNPKEAIFSGMIENAMETVDIDHVFTINELTQFLNQYPAKSISMQPIVIQNQMLERSKLENELRKTDSSADSNNQLGNTSEYGCPTCGGVLWEMEEKNAARYRCRVGHAFSSQSLLDEQNRVFEDTIWSALRALEEKLSFSTKLIKRMSARGQSYSLRHYEQEAQKTKKQIEDLKKLLHDRSFSDQSLYDQIENN
jgi:two-component system chemotaxis response regulator CheB